ncbi:cupin domain-containing protein [Thalassotalea litorea]|uniref:cupin domain-containing protein n=1 Tax=Thalassotalea litorea TaxID=2020715 RepID=UPI0037370E8C
MSLLTSKNVFEQLPSGLDSEIFDALYDKAGVKIERIISNGQSSPRQGWYEQEHDEWVMVIQGSAVLGFEDSSKLSLSVGDHVLIPAMLKHKVLATSRTPATIWLAVHASNPSKCFSDSDDDKQGETS